MFEVNDKVRNKNNGKIGIIKKIKPEKAIVQFNAREKSIQYSDLEKVDSEETEALEDKFINGSFSRLSDVAFMCIQNLFDLKDSNRFNAMGMADVDFYPHQYKPLVKISKSHINGILIADEVGLGKTISAGLCWQELSLREKNYRSLCIVCPKSLCEKWKIELQSRFQMDVDILPTSQSVRDKVQDLSSRSSTKRAYIMSHAVMRNCEEVWDEYDLQNKIFDVLVLDEAHIIRNRNKTHSAMKSLLEHVNFKVFLSATPVQNKTDDLYNLLYLLDAPTFPHPTVFDKHMQTTREIQDLQTIIENTADKSVIINSLQEKRSFMHEDVYAYVNDLLNQSKFTDKERLRILNFLDDTHIFSHVYTRTIRRDIDLERVERKVELRPVPFYDNERFMYEKLDEYIEEYCEENHDSISMAQFIKTMPLKYICSHMHTAVQRWRNATSNIEKSPPPSLWNKLFSSDFNMNYDDSLSNEDKNNIGELIQYIGQRLNNMDEATIANLAENDSKLEELKEILNHFFTAGKAKKCLIFTQYKEVAEYLNKAISEDYETICVHGGHEDKNKAVETFKDDDEKQILIATETLAEGVDLQFCAHLVNFDLPWNPMKLEQRIGRLDRIGQEHKEIHVINLCSEGAVDQNVYEKLGSKFFNIISLLGRYEDVLEQQVKRYIDSVLQGNSSDEEDALSITIEKINEQAREIENNAHHMASHKYVIEKIKKQHDDKEYVTASDLYRLLEIAFKKYLTSCDIRRIKDLNGNISVELTLDGVTENKLAQFMQAKGIKYPTKLTSGQRTYNVVLADYKFKNEYEVIIHDHPLIAFVAEESNKQKISEQPISSGRITLNDNQSTITGDFVLAYKRITFDSYISGVEDLIVGYDLQNKMILTEEQCHNIITTLRANDNLSPIPDIDSLMPKSNREEIYTQLTDILENKTNDFLNENKKLLQAQIGLRLSSITNRYNEEIEQKRQSREKAINTLRQKNKKTESIEKAWDGQIRALEDKFLSDKEKLEYARENIKTDADEKDFDFLAVIEIH